MIEERHWTESTTEQPLIELREDGRRPRLVGYAAVFNSPSRDMGGLVEVIRPGAFARSLRSGSDVPARVQHQGGLMTIGRTKNGSLRLSEDSRGLRYEVTPPDTSVGRDIVELVRGGYIDQSSFAFVPFEGGMSYDSTTDPPQRILTDVDLRDVAPVSGPAYEDTTVVARALAGLYAHHASDDRRRRLELLKLTR